MDEQFKLLDSFKFFDKPENYPENKISEKEVYQLAEYMHKIYEWAAVKAGWKTQEECQVDFKDLPEANRKTMAVKANMILDALYRDLKRAGVEVRK